MTYLHRNSFGGPVHVRSGKAEQLKAGADKTILAAVVVSRPITMIASVVFDDQALNPIEQIWTAQEPTSIVLDGNLNLRSREPRKHEQHSQPGLHWGLGLRLRHLNNTSKPCDALGSWMPGDMDVQIRDRDQPGVKEHVGGDHSFYPRISASEVDDRTQCRRGRQITPETDLLDAEGSAAN